MVHMDREIVMYSRTFGCPYVRTAERVFAQRQIAYRTIHIDRDAAAKKRVVDWTGFESVPTIVVANLGEDLPFEEPDFLAQGRSPRGVNRGSMITEPSEEQLVAWLREHQFI
jgi:glutaredoxin